VPEWDVVESREFGGFRGCSAGRRTPLNADPLGGIELYRSSSARAQRLRSQALWAFLIAGIGLGAALVGFAQYAYSGEVSVRPGRAPLIGSVALQSPLALFLASSAFAACGFVLRARAARHDAA
jgi:hypothetical protein